MKIKWEGIPEKYWPDTERPWRVTYGVGCFEDFATLEEAQAFAEEDRRERPDFLPAGDPFNATERVSA